MRRAIERPTWAIDLVLARIEAGLTQAQLAVLAGVNQDQVAKWETGKHAPSPQNLAKVIDVLALAGAERARS